MVIPLGAFSTTLAVVAVVASTLYYLKLDIAFGVTMAIAFFAMCALASEMTARLSALATLGWAAGIFIFGWLLCRRPRHFRLFIYYLYQYWRCVRLELGSENPLPSADG